MLNYAYAINFGDNDFYYTFMPILDAIGERVRESQFTKEQFVKIVNELSFGFYLAFQNRFEYGNDDRECTRNYLKITELKVLINGEIEEYLTSNNSWNNSETFILYCPLDKSQKTYTVCV